jgi:hypothetical protein
MTLGLNTHVLIHAEGAREIEPTEDSARSFTTEPQGAIFFRGPYPCADRHDRVRSPAEFPETAFASGRALSASTLEPRIPDQERRR